MVGFVNLLSSRQKALQKQCLKGRKSRMYRKGGAVTARGWLISLKMSEAIANASDRQLRWVWVARGIWTTQPDFMYLGYWRGSQGKIHLLIVFEYYIWIPRWPQGMNGLCSWFLQPLPDRVLALWLSQASPGSQAGHLLRSPLLNASPRCLFSLIDIPALETRSWLLSHFRILFWGSWNTCPLIACHSASGPGWQARLLWLMMWLMDKIRKNIQKTISVWSGVSASLHQVAAEGIFCCMPHYTVMAFPGKAVSFHDTRQQAALWALGPPSPEEGIALKSGHFQKCLKLLFCCHEFNMNQHNMKWAWGILVTSDFFKTAV